MLIMGIYLHGLKTIEMKFFNEFSEVNSEIYHHE